MVHARPYELSRKAGPPTTPPTPPPSKQALLGTGGRVRSFGAPLQVHAHSTVKEFRRVIYGHARHALRHFYASLLIRHGSP
jgi:hypothetical protein